MWRARSVRSLGGSVKLAQAPLPPPCTTYLPICMRVLYHGASPPPSSHLPIRMQVLYHGASPTSHLPICMQVLYHGAAIANLVFMRRGSVLVEVYPWKSSHGFLYYSTRQYQHVTLMPLDNKERWRISLNLREWGMGHVSGMLWGISCQGTARCLLNQEAL